MSPRSIALVVVAFGAVSASTTSAAPDIGTKGPYLGTYTASLTSAQAAQRGDSRMTGAFRLVLRRNGTYTVTNPLDGASTGKFRALAGKRLRFFEDTGCLAGGFERPRGGIYSWSLNGKQLTFRLVNEGPCWGRTQSLTYAVWKRSS